MVQCNLDFHQLTQNVVAGKVLGSSTKKNGLFENLKIDIGPLSNRFENNKHLGDQRLGKGISVRMQCVGSPHLAIQTSPKRRVITQLRCVTRRTKHWEKNEFIKKVARRLTQIKQRKSVIQWAMEFEGLSDMLEWEIWEKCTMFKRGFKQHVIKEALVSSDDYSNSQ